MKVDKRKYGQDLIEKIPQYKLSVLEEIVSNDEIAKLLVHDSSDAMFLDVTDEDKEGLLYDKVIPFRFVPDIIEDQGTYITFEFGRIRMLEEGYTVYDDYLSGQITFFIFTHQRLMRTMTGVRVDLLLAEISKLFNKSRIIGIGEMKVRSVDTIHLHNNKFSGYAISFSISDT